MSKDIATNRKALHDFHILEKFEAGIELKGTEVKSIRSGHVHIRDAFAQIHGGQIFLLGCDIKPYASASHEQHLPRRQRRLLMHRKEIDKLEAKLNEKGLSLPVLRVYWKDRKVFSGRAARRVRTLLEVALQDWDFKRLYPVRFRISRTGAVRQE